MLQKLGYFSPRPVLPGPKTYKMLLGGLFQFAGQFETNAVSSSAIGRMKRFSMMPLPLLFAISYAKPAVTSIALRYLRAILPAPFRSDKSLREDGEVDPDYELKVFNNDGTSTDYAASSVLDLLAHDLQAIGRIWQIFADRVSELLTAGRDTILVTVGLKSASSRRRSSVSSVQSMPADLRTAMDATPQNIIPPHRRSRSRSQGTDAQTPNRNTNGVAHARVRNAELISATSENSSDEGESQPRAQQNALMVSTPRSSSSSSVQSRSQTPPAPIEITTSNGSSGAMRMEVSIPINFDERRTSQGFQPPPISESDSDSSSGHASQDSTEKLPRYRVTRLSCFAARSMAQILSEQVTELLFLPLEASFVRSVALFFCASPGSPFASRGIGSGKGEILPIGSWFGLGLKHGGWRGAAGYAIKIFLVWGLYLGCRFLVWDITAGFMWWRGLRRYGWGTL